MEVSHGRTVTIPKIPLANPTHQLPANDAGAQTTRNFRYQHLYGVVLLIGAATKRHDYRAVWCEQEDDLLGEIDDDMFDSYQVKSRKPEEGPWTCRCDGFSKAIKVFVGLEARFPGCFRWFNFVSNIDTFDTTVVTLQHKCPCKLADWCRNSAKIEDLPTPAKKAIKALAKATDCEEEKILVVLKRLRFAKAPDRDAMFAELVSSHLPQIDDCAELAVRRVSKLARDLLDSVEDAGALATQDPSRHYAFVSRGDRADPQLRNKRFGVPEFLVKVNEKAAPGFRYIPSLTASPLAQKDRKFRRFLKKLERGGISHYADTLRNQATSTEALLFDLVTRSKGAAEVDQLRQLVKAECDLAHLTNSAKAEPFGADMLREVDKRLSMIAEKTPARVGNHPKEVLLGTAGILTDDCEVWWSERFDVESEL